MSGLVLAFDPDTKTTGWAVASIDRVLAVGIIKGSPMLRSTAVFLETFFKQARSHEPTRLIVVEGQKIYPAAKQRPNDILKLTHVAGGIHGQCLALCPGTRICIPEPAEWKGQTKKPINQARTYKHYGIQYSVTPTYAYPAGCAVAAKIAGYSKVSQADWKHIGDAVGLARYGAELLLRTAP